MPDSDRIGYHGPARKPEDVIASAFRNEELMRQLVASYEAELRGEMGTPLKELQAKHRVARTT
ncbi:MAG: hypothetical protein ACRDJE_02615 [Dehalococcoidia bacterium]